VGPYTITKIHNDDTIEIKTIYQRELGRWRSIKFLPYDWVNPNQVITFDQEGVKILTAIDHEEVHQKMLECYSIQPISKGTLGGKLTNGIQTIGTGSLIALSSTK
jgi:hypothetical protein